MPKNIKIKIVNCEISRANTSFVKNCVLKILHRDDRTHEIYHDIVNGICHTTMSVAFLHCSLRDNVLLCKVITQVPIKKHFVRTGELSLL